ncbi:hypothetical protein SAMN04488498_110113 [Mesorhizobium albiziae]|uniref:Uncharacterized protein n=1 Tax=Neomesorhizobium albiziae TaxID=335020 RepID=A0A1I4BHE5_9HYPH|nr:hypothetical protein [Mesorhizobium albiziae]GLS29847.1 hypothetical protein GCM10007937_15550 [Mesorhizobium albiziae]SFK67439.1 hypothetical protein SAMN04488498_110113 [Mesorhizobium albiziae]
MTLQQRFLAAGLAVSISGTAAFAQSMSPMRGEVASFTDAFAVRVFPANPYEHRIKVEIRVYDQDFRPVQARVAPSDFMLGGQASRPVLVVVPFDGAATRKVRICTESVPFPGEQTQIKAQICGKFLGQHKS